MKTIPAASAAVPVPPPRSASRFMRSVRINQPVVASNGDFIRAWAARRAKLARTPRSPRT